MDDILLIQTIERYLNGEMTTDEKNHFENLRQSNATIDQKVVEHSLFLHQIDNFSSRYNFKNTLTRVHQKLVNENAIETKHAKPLKVQFINLVHRYKKVTAIAAAVGGCIALFTSVLVSKYNNNAPAVELLSYKQQQQQQQIAALNNALNKSKIPVKAEVLNGGSSFLIDGDGYLVTNAHVLDGATSTSVYDENGKEYNALIAYKNNNTDLAILKIDDEDFEPINKLPYSIKKTSVDLGEEVYTIGFPNFPRTDVVYNIGYLSSLKGYNGDTATYQIQMNANHGNSGGPIFNKRGEVVGVLNKRLSNADGVSFAIHSKGIYQIVDELKATDSTISNLKLNSSLHLNGESRVNQIKQVEQFVYMVKAYKK